MEDFLRVLNQVLVLFLLLVVGFGARRLGIIEKGHLKGLTGLITKVTLPAMVIASMASNPFSPELLAESGIVLGFSIVVYAFFILLSIPLGALFKAPAEDTGVYRFVMVFSNVGYMGFPVVEAIFGKEALFYAAIYNLPFNALAFSVGVIMLLYRKGKTGFALSWRVLVSPVIVSVFVGYLLFILGLRLPGPLNDAVVLTGDMTTPLSMVTVGAMLAGTSVRRTFSQGRLYILGFLRLIVWPLGVFAVLRPLSPNFILAAVPAVIAGMPAAANTAILAHEYQANEGLAAQALFLTTLFSVITIPFISWLFSLWG